MTRYVIVAVAILLVLASCHEPPSTKVHDLKSIIDSFDQLDKKYNGSWHDELLTVRMLPMENIDDYLDEIIALNSTVAEQLQNSNDSLLPDFIGTRIAMLKSQKYYYLALEADPRGLADIEFNGTSITVNASIDDFDCANRDNINKANEFLNLTLAEGHKYLNLMDYVLQNSAEAQELIGLDEKRPYFYISPLGRVLQTIRINTLLILQLCNKKVFKAPSNPTPDGNSSS